MLIKLANFNFLLFLILRMLKTTQTTTKNELEDFLELTEPNDEDITETTDFGNDSPSLSTTNTPIVTLNPNDIERLQSILNDTNKKIKDLQDKVVAANLNLTTPPDNVTIPAICRNFTTPSTSNNDSTNTPIDILPEINKTHPETNKANKLVKEGDTTNSTITESRIGTLPPPKTHTEKNPTHTKNKPFTCNCPPELVRNTSKEFRDIFTHFWPYEKIEKYLFYIAETHADRVNLTELGKTHEKRSIYAMQIGMGLEYNNIVFIDAGMNARQWGSIMMALYIIHVLTECNMYERIAYIDWLIIPVVNPDGYAYSFSDPKQRMWNKNKTPCPNGTDLSKCQDTHGCGIDINRNFLHMFVGGGKHPCSDFYAGRSPLSEIEANVTTELLRRFRNQIKLYLGIHTYGAAFLYPFTSKIDLTDINQKELEELAEHAVAAINNHSSSGEKYIVGNYAKVVVPEWGTLLDQVKGNGIRYSYYLHLKGHHKLRDDEIFPIISECFYGICEMVRELYATYPASKKFLRQFKGFRRRRRNGCKNLKFVDNELGIFIAMFYFLIKLFIF